MTTKTSTKTTTPISTNLSTSKSPWNLKNHGLFVGLYGVTILAVLLSSLLGMPWLNWVFKPLLMPLLIWFVWINTRKQEATGSSNDSDINDWNGLTGLTSLTKWLLAALFFSWLGDIFMIFQHDYEIGFLLGLGNFLIAHICYIFVFGKTSSPNSQLASGSYSPPKDILRQKPYLLLPFLAYAAVLLYMLYPNLGDMFVPVLVYASIISLMAIFAVRRYGKVNARSFHLVWIGALIFIASDSIIAIHKFLVDVPYSYIWIILAYCLGQYFIAIGILSQRNSVNIS